VKKRPASEKPEAIRQALTEYFNKLDEQQFRRAGIRFLEKQSEGLENARRIK
jgi:hypothetical protein